MLHRRGFFGAIIAVIVGLFIPQKPPAEAATHKKIEKSKRELTELLMQLHDKQLISTQTLIKELGQEQLWNK